MPGIDAIVDRLNDIRRDLPNDLPRTVIYIPFHQQDCGGYKNSLLESAQEFANSSCLRALAIAVHKDRPDLPLTTMEELATAFGQLPKTRQEDILQKIAERVPEVYQHGNDRLEIRPEDTVVVYAHGSSDEDFVSSVAEEDEGESISVGTLIVRMVEDGVPLEIGRIKLDCCGSGGALHRGFVDACTQHGIFEEATIRGYGHTSVTNIGHLQHLDKGLRTVISREGSRKLEELGEVEEQFAGEYKKARKALESAKGPSAVSSRELYLLTKRMKLKDEPIPAELRRFSMRLSTAWEGPPLDTAEGKKKMRDLYDELAALEKRQGQILALLGQEPPPVNLEELRCEMTQMQPTMDALTAPLQEGAALLVEMKQCPGEWERFSWREFEKADECYRNETPEEFLELTEVLRPSSTLLQKLGGSLDALHEKQIALQKFAHAVDQVREGRNAVFASEMFRATEHRVDSLSQERREARTALGLDVDSDESVEQPEEDLGHARRGSVGEMLHQPGLHHHESGDLDEGIDGRESRGLDPSHELSPDPSKVGAQKEKKAPKVGDVVQYAGGHPLGSSQHQGHRPD